MILTPQQSQELLELLEVYVLKFAANNITDRYLSAQDKALLRKWGIDPTTARTTVDDAFKFGMLAEALGTQAVKHMGIEQIRKYIKSKQFLPLDYREKKALESLRFQAFNQIKGLGNKLSNDMMSINVEVDKRQRTKYERIIKQAAKKAILDRESIGMMSSEIGHKTKDWARDLDRISDYVLHDAHDHGRAYQIKKNLGTGALTYKKVFNQACKSCIRLYLTAGWGSEPIIYKVDTLLRNGSNIGKKTKEWKPVIGATHPWCRCEVVAVYPGSVWNDKTQQFEVQLTSEEKEIGDLVKIKIG